MNSFIEQQCKFLIETLSWYLVNVQLLTKMDGLEQRKGVFIVATTNRYGCFEHVHLLCVSKVM